MCIFKWRINMSRRKSLWGCGSLSVTLMLTFLQSAVARATVIITEPMAPVLHKLSMNETFSGVHLWPSPGSVCLTPCQIAHNMICCTLDTFKSPCSSFKHTPDHPLQHEQNALVFRLWVDGELAQYCCTPEIPFTVATDIELYAKHWHP